MYNIKDEIDCDTATVPDRKSFQITTDEKVYLRDTSAYIYSSATGIADVVGLRSTIIVDCGRVMHATSFPHNDVTQTEQAAALAKCCDGGAFVNLNVSGGAGGYAANYQLFPGTEAEDDAVYFGKATPFGAVYMDMSATVGVYNDDTVTWEYYNGTTWATLSIVWDETDTTANDGKRPFQGDGYIFFSAPTDWASTTIDTQAAYWIRARVSAAEMTTAPLTNDVEHKTFAFDAATRVPYPGTIGRGVFAFETVSGSTDNTDVILVNGTSGACSAVKVITKAKKDVAIADFALVVAKDDVIGFFCTDEDGSTEYAGGTCSLEVVRS